MGRASSRKTVNRVARASGSARRARSLGWTAALVGIVALGATLVVVSRGGGARDTGAPRIGDHWHAAYAVYDCDKAVAPFGDTMQESGLHTHTDGLIHVEPRATSETGANATLAKFLDAAGAKIDDPELRLPGGKRLGPGSSCGGKKAQLAARVWENGAATGPGRVVTGAAIGALALRDGLAISLGVTADGSSLPAPASLAGLTKQRG